MRPGKETTAQCPERWVRPPTNLRTRRIWPEDQPKTNQINKISLHFNGIQVREGKVTYGERELTGIVVHSARVHEGQDVTDGVGFQHLIARRRTDAAVCQCGRNHRHALAVHFHRATLKMQRIIRFLISYFK